jgi:RNA methyltransferase, TrmH family
MLSRAEAKRLHALARERARAETGLFLAEGVRLVEELLASTVVPRVALIAPSLEDTDRGAQLARRLRAAVRTVDVAEHELARVAATDAPQGVVVAAEMPRFELGRLHLGPRAVAVVLDAVQDPGNFGTIVRSADAFGADVVCCLPGTVDPWNPKAVRAAAGSSLRVPIVVAGLEQLLEFLRSADFQLLGADMGGAAIEGVRRRDRVALVLGNEGAGLTVAVRAHLDATVAVPIRGAAESLNVGVAAGILLYLLTREADS